MQAVPRQSILARQSSSNQILVNHEVTVSSSHTNAPHTRPSTITSARPSYERRRTLSPSGLLRRDSSITAAIERIRETNSRMSNHADGPRRPTFESEDSNYGFQSATPYEYIDPDVQNTRDLAHFLMTEQPPRSNLMAERETNDSKNPLAMFKRRRKRSKSHLPQNIKLPDSAVAARTAEGRWHIAISIPNEYDLLDGVPNDQKASGASTMKSQIRATTSRSNTGAVTVLKPVNEDRPLSTASDPAPSDYAQQVISRVFADEGKQSSYFEERFFETKERALDRRIADLTAVKEIIAEKEVLQIEARSLLIQKEHVAQEEAAIREQLAIANARALSNSRPTTGSRQASRAQLSSGGEPLEDHMMSLQEIPRPQSGQPNNVRTRSSRAYIGLAPPEEPDQGHAVDQRHSGGTAYSTQTLEFEPQPTLAPQFIKGHMRGASSISTAPSMSNATINMAQVATGVNTFRDVEPVSRFSSKKATTAPSMIEVTSSTIDGPGGQPRKRYSTQAVGAPGGNRELVPSETAKTADTSNTRDSRNDVRRTKSSDSSNSTTIARFPYVPEHTLPAGEVPSRGSSNRMNSRRPLSSLGRSKTGTSTAGQNSIETRKEHVRALRARDIAQQKERRTSLVDPQADENGEQSGIDKLSNLPVPGAQSISNGVRLPPRRSFSVSPSRADRLKVKSQNSISRIMLVADTLPGGESPQKERQNSAATLSSNASAPETHTPPRSTASSVAGSEPEAGYTYSAAKTTQTFSVPTKAFGAANKQQPTNSHLNHWPTPPYHPEQPPSTENPTAILPPSASLDTRLALIEKNHALMMSALSSVLAMGQGLGELTRVLDRRASNAAKKNRPSKSRIVPTTTTTTATSDLAPHFSSSEDDAEGGWHVTRTEMDMLKDFESERQGAFEVVGKGLNDIEPFMRELAGAARVSQEGTPEASPEINQGAFVGF